MAHLLRAARRACAAGMAPAGATAASSPYLDPVPGAASHARGDALASKGDAGAKTPAHANTCLLPAAVAALPPPSTLSRRRVRAMSPMGGSAASVPGEMLPWVPSSRSAGRSAHVFVNPSFESTPAGGEAPAADVGAFVRADGATGGEVGGVDECDEWEQAERELARGAGGSARRRRARRVREAAVGAAGGACAEEEEGGDSEDDEVTLHVRVAQDPAPAADTAETEASVADLPVEQQSEVHEPSVDALLAQLGVRSADAAVVANRVTVAEAGRKRAEARIAQWAATAAALKELAEERGEELEGARAAAAAFKVRNAAELAAMRVRCVDAEVGIERAKACAAEAEAALAEAMAAEVAAIAACDIETQRAEGLATVRDTAARATEAAEAAVREAEQSGAARAEAAAARDAAVCEAGAAREEAGAAQITIASAEAERDAALERAAAAEAAAEEQAVARSQAEAASVAVRRSAGAAAEAAAHNRARVKELELELEMTLVEVASHKVALEEAAGVTAKTNEELRQLRERDSKSGFAAEVAAGEVEELRIALAEHRKREEEARSVEAEARAAAAEQSAAAEAAKARACKAETKAADAGRLRKEAERLAAALRSRDSLLRDAAAQLLAARDDCAAAQLQLGKSGSPQQPEADGGAAAIVAVALLLARGAQVEAVGASRAEVDALKAQADALRAANAELREQQRATEAIKAAAVAAGRRVARRRIVASAAEQTESDSSP